MTVNINPPFFEHLTFTWTKSQFYKEPMTSGRNGRKHCNAITNTPLVTDLPTEQPTNSLSCLLVAHENTPGGTINMHIPTYVTAISQPVSTYEAYRGSQESRSGCAFCAAPACSGRVRVGCVPFCVKCCKWVGVDEINSGKG